MSNKASDKNVANVEDDVNELKRLLYSDALTQYGKRKIINYYEQRIQEIEEELTKYKSLDYMFKIQSEENYVDMKKIYFEWLDSIPTQVIIDKIKEYDQKMEEDAGRPNWVITDRIVMNVLQELLGEEKNRNV